MAKRATRAQWLERVRSWKASGKTRAEFTAKEDYSERSLGWWAWKLSSEGESLDAKPRKGKRSVKKAKSIELVELVTQSDVASRGLTMRLGSVELLVERGFDRELLGTLLDVLEARR
ncbi:MAG: IS66 family insertion sequence element accessory protein TnpA [Nannocystaceae bacterium]|nr:hypothetical protein [bacterium]